MLDALHKTLVFFIQYRLLSLKFWYAVVAMSLAIYATVHVERFSEAKYLGLIVNAFVGLGGHLWGQKDEAVKDGGSSGGPTPGS
jgi:hypothetical protein